MKMARRNARNGGVHGNANPTMMEMLRGIVAQLEVVETSQRRGQHVEDVSEDLEEEVAGEQVENLQVNDPDEERFIKPLSRVNSRSHFSPPDYDGKLDSNELLD